jgi:hypothetical protein
LDDRLVAINSASSTGCEWGDKTTDENHVLTPVLAGDGSVLGAVTLLKTSPMQSSVAHSCCSEGKPRSGYPERPYLLSDTLHSEIHNELLLLASDKSGKNVPQKEFIVAPIAEQMYRRMHCTQSIQEPVFD